MKPAGQYIKEKKESELNMAWMDFYCDKRPLFGGGKMCGGRLYNVFGKGQVATYRLDTSASFYAGKCIKCGKKYDIPV